MYFKVDNVDRPRLASLDKGGGMRVDFLFTKDSCSKDLEVLIHF